MTIIQYNFFTHLGGSVDNVAVSTQLQGCEQIFSNAFPYEYAAKDKCFTLFENMLTKKKNYGNEGGYEEIIGKMEMKMTR